MWSGLKDTADKSLAKMVGALDFATVWLAKGKAWCATHRGWFVVLAVLASPFLLLALGLLGMLALAFLAGVVVATPFLAVRFAGMYGKAVWRAFTHPMRWLLGWFAPKAAAPEQQAAPAEAPISPEALRGERLGVPKRLSEADLRRMSVKERMIYRAALANHAMEAGDKDLVRIVVRGRGGKMVSREEAWLAYVEGTGMLAPEYDGLNARCQHFADWLVEASGCRNNSYVTRNGMIMGGVDYYGTVVDGKAVSEEELSGMRECSRALLAHYGG